MYEKINKANSMMGLICISFIHMDEDMLKKLFKALVRQLLQYANLAWLPTKVKDKQELKMFNKKLLNYVLTLKNLTHEECLWKLDLPTLQFRRLRDLIETYKIVTGKYDDAVNNILPK